MALLAIGLAVTACGRDQATDNEISSSEQAGSTQTATPTPSPGLFRTAPAGPDVLSTVGLYDNEQLTNVRAKQGQFTIETVNGLKTLAVNGKPAKFIEAGADLPQAVEANSDLTLVGVFELPEESVAWAIITGGTACPATHVLVSVRAGHALPGQAIPGCDNRGTIRRQGDKLAFEAGGSDGTYQDGMLSVTVNATTVQQAPDP